MSRPPMAVRSLEPLPLPPLPDEPLVSVLVPNYNYARFLDDTMGSVLSQTWANLEVVVCDDGSTDESVDVLRRWERNDDRVKVLVQDNAGHAAALNTAFGASSGDIVALLDSDDWWSPNKLARSIEVFRARPEVGYLAHALNVVAADGRLMSRTSAPRFPRNGWLCPTQARGGWRGTLGTNSAMVARREVAVRVFDLPTSWHEYVDRLFAERCAMVAKVAPLDEALVFYRIHGANRTGVSNRLVDEAGLERAFARFRAIAADRVEFIRRIHGVELDPVRIESVFAGELGLRLRVVRGERPGLTTIRAATPSRLRAAAWVVLFAVPTPAARYALERWTDVRVGPRRPLRVLKRLIRNTRASRRRRA